ncbi:MAG: response regulator [Planctomycetes bacterium]|nr:response regulator [Planctomycetota bacterium]
MGTARDPKEPLVDPKDLSVVLDAILEGMQVLGPDWRYLHVNEVAARHGHTTRERLLGRTVFECYPGFEQTAVFTAMRACMTERTPCVMENEFTYPDGSKAWFELRIEPVPQGICVLSLDVTARKLAETERQRAELRLQHALRMEAIGLLAAGIAHDFNNLLTVVLSQAEIGLARAGGPTPEDLQTIVTAARSAADLTRQLLAYGRRSMQRREVVDPREVVEGIAAIVRRSLREGIELVLDLDRPVQRVDVDRVQLEQIVMNLVVNAADAIRDRGRITVALDRADLDSDYVLRHPDARRGPHTVLVVADTGIGMDAATQARIFEPFFTTKAERGSGLGLATVYGIVKQHGGSIEVRSAPASGTTFLVHLPCAARPESAPSAATRPAAERTPLPPARLLVVDDRREIAELMRRMLVGDGHTVHVATAGESALAMWRRDPAGIDALITDYGMPGMTGAELIASVRADRPELPVVCTSAWPEPHFARQWSGQGSVLFLEKPFTRSQLREVLANALDGRD